MERELTPNEIDTAVTTTRITSSIITEEEYPYVVELHHRLKESGYLEAVRGLARMERELGVPCSDAVARYKGLLAEVEGLTAQEAHAREKTIQAEATAWKARETAATEREAMDRARDRREIAEHQFAAFREEAQQERQRLDAEVKMAREKAAMDRAEIASATELKGKLEARGLRLPFVLDLVQEIPDDEARRERLATALEEYDTLDGAITALTEEKTSIQEEVAGLREKRAGLEKSCRDLGEKLARLRADVKHDKRLREFHRKFQHVAPLMEYISTWGPLAFCRVQFAMSPVYRVLTVDGTPLPSPFGTAVKWEWDLEAYKALNLPVGPIDLD